VRARSAKKSGGRVLWWSPAPAVDDDDIAEDEEEEEVAGGETSRSTTSSVVVAVGLRSRQPSPTPLAGSTRSMTCTTGERGGVLIRRSRRSSERASDAGAGKNRIVNHPLHHSPAEEQKWALDQSLK
jgi:hypothetical protein